MLNPFVLSTNILHDTHDFIKVANMYTFYIHILQPFIIKDNRKIMSLACLKMISKYCKYQ